MLLSFLLLASMGPTAAALSLGGDGLGLPSLPLPGTGDDPLDRVLGSDGPNQDASAEDEEPVGPHQLAAPTTSASDAGEGWSPWTLLWGLPFAVLGLAGVLVSRQRHQGERGHEPGGKAKPATDAPRSEAAQDPGAPAEPRVRRPGVDGVLELGQKAVADGRWEDAVTWFETAIAARPQVAVAHHCLGLCLFELGRYEDAADVLGHAASLAPGDPAVTYHRARALVRAGETKRALELIVPVLDAYPSLFEQVQEDPAFRGLRDHPRLLSRLGRL